MKKYIISLIGILAVAPVLIGLGVKYFNFAVFAGDNNTWISFWGSYLGSIVTVILAAGISYIVTRNENDRTAEIAKKQAIEELRLKESHEAMQSTVKTVNLIYQDTNLINRNAINILGDLIDTTSRINFEDSVSVYKCLYIQASTSISIAEIDWHYDEERANVDSRYTYVDDIIYELDFVKDYLVVQVSDKEELQSNLKNLMECYEKMGELVKLIFSILNIHTLYSHMPSNCRDIRIRENMDDTNLTIRELKELNEFFKSDDIKINLIEKYTNEIRKKYERLFNEKNLDA